MQDPQIKSLLGQLQQMQNRIEEESFSQEEYKELALSLGLSYTDWNKLEKAYEDFIGRAKGYIQHQLGEEALLELEQARFIQPQGEDLALLMAQAHLVCYKEKGKRSDQKAVKDWAQRQLQLNPEDQRAMQLLVQLKTLEATTLKVQNAAPQFDLAKVPQTKQKPINKKANGIALVILMALLAVGVLVLMPGRSHDRIDQVPELVAPQVVKGSSQSIAARWEKSNIIAGDGEIIELSATLETTASQQKKEFSYHLNGYFKPIVSGSGSAICWLYYLDENGEKLWTSPLNLDIPKGSKAGDYIPIQDLHQSSGDPPPVAEILVELELVNIKETTNEMLEKELVVLAEKRNQKHFFKAEAVASELDYNQFSNAVYHHLSLRLKQSASQPIQKLKANIIYINGSGQPIDKQELLLIGPKDSPLSNRYPYIKEYQIKTALKNAQEVADYQIELLEIEE